MPQIQKATAWQHLMFEYVERHSVITVKVEHMPDLSKLGFSKPFVPR